VKSGRTKKVTSARLMREAFAGEAPIVEVLWHDAAGDGDWTSKLDLEPAPTASVGYLVRRDRTAVRIVSLVNDGDAAYTLVVPTGMVKEIRYLQR
jgi:hypothetical protein